MVNKFLPFINLYSVEGHINPAFAPEAVLASVPGMSPEDVKTIISARQRDDWKNTDIEEVLDRLQEFLALEEIDVFAVNLRLVGGTGLILGTQVEATLLLDRNSDVPYHVLAWSW